MFWQDENLWEPRGVTLGREFIEERQQMSNDFVGNVVSKDWTWKKLSSFHEFQTRYMHSGLPSALLILA